MSRRTDLRSTQTLHTSVRPVRDVGAQLVVIAGPDRGRRVELGAGKLVLGRTADSAFPLSCRSVSTRHAAIRRDGDGYTIEDLGSRNGTRVAGQHVEAHTRRHLRHGDMVVVGREVLLFADARANAGRDLGPLRFDKGRVRDEVDALLGDLGLPGASAA